MRKTICLLALLGCLAVSAAASAPYSNYAYDADGETVPAPSACDLYAVVDAESLGTPLNEPSDLFVRDGKVYVADTGNNRILILDGGFSLLGVVDSFDNGGREDAFQQPEGIFAAADGALYVADTGNGRVVVLEPTGRLRAVYGAPESEILGDMFEYLPTKIAADSAGRLFVVSRNCNLGLLELDREGRFVRVLGAPKVVANPIEQLWKRFSTREQKRRMGQFVPTEYNNLFVDAEDFVYVTNNAYQKWQEENGDAVRKLNALGNDVLTRRDGRKAVGDLDYPQTGTYIGPSSIVDVFTRPNGVYHLLDSRRGRVFTYDADGNLLFVFGGPGEYAGTFVNPRALVCMGDLFLVLDAGKNQITVCRATPYAAAILNAVERHAADEYNEELAQWQQALHYNANCGAARVGIGKAYLRSGEYAQAMACFRQAQDRDNYSKAYQYYRREMLGEHFPLMMAILIGAAAAAIAASRIRKRLTPRRAEPSPSGAFSRSVGYAGYILAHPFRGFWELKRERRGSLSAACLFLGLTCLLIAAERQLTGFLFNQQDPAELNLLLEFSKVLLPFFLWCGGNWCVTSLMEGEGRFTEIVTAAGYALVPLLICHTLALVLSNVATQAEGAFYTFFLILGAFWTGALILAGNMELHNYTMSRSLFVALLTVLVMAIVVFLGILIVMIVQEMVGFGADVYNELALRF
ncbi:MAG TPA: YIP1 family protein [Firmicutes bacterium]|nr:YIP1 family protein [Bacillota bacterium]